MRVSVRAWNWAGGAGEFIEVRVKTDNPDEPWFIAKDVCDILALNNVSQAASYLDDDEKMNIIINEFQSPGRGGDTGKSVLVNEPGIYSLILRSRVPAAKEFKRWVTHDVLPSIRKHGAYMSPAKLVELIQNPDSITTLLETLRDEQIKNVSA